MRQEKLTTDEKKICNINIDILPGRTLELSYCALQGALTFPSTKACLALNVSSLELPWTFLTVLNTLKSQLQTSSSSYDASLKQTQM